jgi:polyphosphate kinase 2 (PPK2 family)
VERVEKFCGEFDWMRAYQEINDFEEQLGGSGAIVAKFWLAITPAEQLRRFKARENTPYKRFKITAEDWRNRKKWPQYETAVNDMIERTSTEHAPWNVIASDDKLFSRIETLERLCARIEKSL